MTVACSFLSETKLSKAGAWLKTETNFIKLIGMFGDRLKLPLKNTLLGNLDAGQPFLAGKVDRGNFYLMGGEMGVAGKLIFVDENNINVFNGMCTVSFG